MDDLIVVIAAFIAAPFIIGGVYFITKKVIELIMVRKGCIKANFITRNHRIRSVFVAPKGSELKVGDRSFNYNDATGMVVIEGSVPNVWYNEKTAQQMDMTNAKQLGNLDPNYMSDLLIRAYNLGVIASMNAEKLLKTLLIANSIGIGILILMVWIAMGSAGTCVENTKEILAIVGGIASSGV